MHPDDPFRMNWVEGAVPWGTVRCSVPLSVRVNREFTGKGTLKETYEFKNETDRDIFTLVKDISIYTTFNDNYQEASVCMTGRCHAHIWCGGAVSYVMALRMGGAAPHLGLILTKGSIKAYSVERDPDKMSNDRGDFLLHPEPLALMPGETYTVEWELFWHEGKDDFYRQLLNYPGYIHVSAERYVLFEGETVRLNVSDGAGHERRITDVPERTGEHVYETELNGIDARCKIMVLPGLNALAGHEMNHQKQG